MYKRKAPLLLALVLIPLFALDVAATEESLPELVRRVKPSVVSVITYDDKGEVRVTGSGFFVQPGQVITNLHVVEGASRAEVRTFDGKGKTYPVEGLVAVDNEGDLALLTVRMPLDRSQTVETSTALPEEGERIFVIGNPLRLEGSVSDGIVSAIREVPSVGRIIQITAPISHGNSGSPVFNMKGQVVGIVTIRVMNGQNINLALGVSRAADLKSGEQIVGFDEISKTRTSVRSETLADWSYRSGLNSLWLGNYDSALTFFETAVNRNPDRADAWIQVGFCKVKQGKNSDAIRAFQQALKLRPNSYEAHNKLGDAYYFSGNYLKAVDAYKQAIALRPELAEGYYNLGMAYVELGDKASATALTSRLKDLDSELYTKLFAEIRR